MRVLRDPRPRRATARRPVDLVAGPTTGGIILAFETARQLGVRSIFAEEVRDDDGTLRREFRRGFRIEPGERVLLVDDILTTGGSLLAMLPAVEAMGGEIVECVVLVDRSGGRASLTSPASGRVYPLRSLWQLDLPTYEPGPATCPRCADGTPLHAPGQQRHRRARAPARRRPDAGPANDGSPDAATCSCSPSCVFVAVAGAAAIAAELDRRPRPERAAAARRRLSA